jgi:hypothetical protein
MVQDNGLQKTIQKEADSKTKIQKPADKATTPTWTDAKVAAKESPAFEFLGEYLKDGKAIQVVPAEGRFFRFIKVACPARDGTVKRLSTSGLSPRTFNRVSLDLRK